MKTWERKFVTAGLALAGFVFLIAAVKPALNGGSFNATFLLVGVVLIVGAGAAWKKLVAGAATADHPTHPSSTPPKSGLQ